MIELRLLATQTQGPRVKSLQSTGRNIFEDGNLLVSVSQGILHSAPKDCVVVEKHIQETLTEFISGCNLLIPS